jgi:hypothetical protein
MFFSRPIHCYHSHADPIWPDGTFIKVQKVHKQTSGPLQNVQIISIYMTDLKLLVVCILSLCPPGLQALNMVEEVLQDSLEGNSLHLLHITSFAPSLPH